MIKAQLNFEEQDNGMVNVEIITPPSDDTETDRETLMLVTFMALNNCLADTSKMHDLGVLLGPEIAKILEEM